MARVRRPQLTACRANMRMPARRPRPGEHAAHSGNTRYTDGTCHPPNFASSESFNKHMHITRKHQAMHYTRLVETPRYCRSASTALQQCVTAVGRAPALFPSWSWLEGRSGIVTYIHTRERGTTWVSARNILQSHTQQRLVAVVVGHGQRLREIVRKDSKTQHNRQV